MARLVLAILLLPSIVKAGNECNTGDPAGGTECSKLLDDQVQTGALLQKRRATQLSTESLAEDVVDGLEGVAALPTASNCDFPKVPLPWATPGQDVDVLGLAQGGPGEPQEGWGETPPQSAPYVVEPVESGSEVAEREEPLPSPAAKKQKKEPQSPLKRHPRRERKARLVEIQRTHQTPSGSAAKFSAVSPTAGSTAGGTTVTIWGQNLYMPHARMDAGGGTSPSSLQPSVRVFMGTLECVVESFQSRPEAVKCVTPALEAENMQFTDVALPVSVMKLQANGTYAPAALDGTTTPTFKFSSAATPELVSVFPQVSGPGDVLRIHAWSCSGVVEAEPMELVRVGSTDNATSQGSNRDGAVNTLVDDPAEAWGAICEPFPPHGVRNELQLATQLEADQAFSNVEGGPENTGARGLYGVLFKDPDEDSLSAQITTPEGMDEFLENNHVARAYRYFIAPSPVLQYDQWWEDTRASYVVVLEGWLLIEHPGAYRFRVACEDRCLVQVGEHRLVDKSNQDRRTAGWYHAWYRNYRIETNQFQFPMGWQRIKIVHVNILNPGGSSGMRIEYEGPPTDGWQVIPQRYLRAGITQATVDGLNRDADRQRVGRSPQSLVPAKRVQQGGRANGAQCPGATDPMKVEFFCKVPQDMQPGFYNVKFHDYHYGQSVESTASQWDVGMGARRASLRIVPKVTKVEQLAGGGLLVTGMGLDELPLLASGGSAHFGETEYHAVNGTQDYIELAPGGPLSNNSAPGGGSTQTLGSRGLLREFWFRNRWPGELEGLGQTPSIGRSAELITPIEDANGAAAGFAERLSGVLVPPMTGECRFRVRGTRRSSRDTENAAQLYLSQLPLSVLSTRGEILSRPRPVLYWPGATFTGQPAEALDLAHLGYEGFFGGAWSLAAKITFDPSIAGTSGTVFEFGHPGQNRIGVAFNSNNRLTFQVCRGSRCKAVSCDNQMDHGNEHQWIFSTSELNVMVISRDDKAVGRYVRGQPTESQSRPYLHLWMGRGVASTAAFSGKIKDVKIFNVAVHWGDAYGPEARAPPAAATAPAPKAPYFALAAELSGQPVQPVDLADRGLGALGGAMSFAFTARWDDLTPESRVLDFANGDSDAIIIKLGSSGSLIFCVTSRCLEASGAVEVGREKHYLVSVNSYGEMFIYSDGVLLAESAPASDRVPGTLERFHLWVGRANSAEPRLHSGLVKNFKIFKGTARWQDAFGAGALSPLPLTPLPAATPVLLFAGRTYSGNASDYDDASAEYDTSTGGAFTVAFTARFDTLVPGAELLSLGGPESKLTVGLDASGALEMQMTSPSHRRRRRNQAPLSSTLDSPAPTLGEENKYLYAVTRRGQVALYKDGALQRDSLTGVPPYIQRAPLIFGKSGFKGLLKNVKLFNGFVRWPQAFPSASSNTSALLQVGSWQRSWTALDQEEKSAKSQVAQMLGAVSSVEFDYGDPVVQTSWDHERASRWMLLRQGEEYPFKLERKLGGKSADTGATGWQQLAFECRSLEGHPELLPRRSELVSMKFKAFPVRVTLPSSPSGYQLSFRGRTASVTSDAGVGTALLGLLGPSCSVQPPVDGTNVQMLKDWEVVGASDPKPDAHCGIGAMKSRLRADGEWMLEREELSLHTYRLQDFPFLSMCFKLEDGAAANMLIKCNVGTRNREQWFSVGMTLPNFDQFHGDYKRAAQWPVDANSSQGQWQCASIDLMSQIMSYQDYERRFRDVNYDPSSFDASHLANMQIKGIYLGTPVRSGNSWQKLRGQVSVDQLLISKSQLSLTQTHPAVLGASLPFSQVLGASTGSGWYVKWFRGYGSYRNLQPTQQPEGQMFSPDVNFNLEYAAPPGVPGMVDQFTMIATARITFEEGRYQWGILVDDEATVYIDGTQVAHRGCCVSWGASRSWSTPVQVTAGAHDVEVHFKEVGGAGHISAVWRKEGSSESITTIPPASGVGESHSIDFVPTARAEQASLKALLQEISISGSTPGLSLNVSLPDGTPNEVITARLLPPPGQWIPAYFVTGTGLDVSVAMNRTEFNALFAKCPVVKYVRNGNVDSVYVRKSQVPTGFDAYSNFLEEWKSADNRMGQDFEIYDHESAARSRTGAWIKCNYDYDGVAYPRDCGKTWWRGNHWFALPSHGGPPGVTTGAGFEIYDGADCFSPAAPAAANTTALEVSFPMSSNATAVAQTLSAAGFPALDYRVLGMGGLRWLDLHSQPATMSPARNGRAANLALDGHFSQSSDYCATTEDVSNPWLTVQLGGTFSVDSVRLLAREGDGGRYLADVTISVDGKVCATNVRVGHGGFARVPCRGGYGSSLTVTRQASGHLVLCELEVAVRDTSLAGSGAEASSYTAMVSSGIPGDQGVRVALTSPMSANVQTTLQSSGTRYWGQVTDYWFRMPHQQKQVTFGSWRDYICATELGSGCAPVAPPAAAPMPGGPSLLHLSSRRHPSLLARPPHTLDGGHFAATMLGRRHPQRRWRRPQRFHTPESLETMRRAVLGTSKRPRGWAEASALLQEHAGRQKHFAGRHSGGAGADPRSDPNALPWSSPSSWGGEQPPNFDSADIVYIPEGKTALLDMDVYIRFWVIEGNLVWSQTKDLHMQAEAVVVNGGEFLIGSETDPYTLNGQITLHGDWHGFKLPLFGSKGIFEPRGNIEFHGKPKAATWTELEHTAYPGDTTITLRTPVDWKAGDHIVIAASDQVVKSCRLDRRDYCQVEERYVQAVDGNVVTLERPLVYRHVAEELDPLFSQEICAEDPSICTKTQMRSEVGLLTRNIKLKGSNFMDGSEPGGSEGYGAHIMMAERGKFSYIEFHWMGQAFQMGRYPIHYHLTGLNPTSYLRGCSLHTTFQRGVTIHGTHQAVVKDNVLYNHLAHGFFIEDGNEHDNVFENNLGMMGHVSLSMLNSDQTPATFWIRNPSNYFRHNHAAGCEAFGFWFDTLDEAAMTLQREFFNNTAHSNADTGVWVDIVDPREGCVSPDGWTIDVPFRNTDAVSQPVHSNAPDCENSPRVNFEFKSMTTWGNGESGVTLFETGHLHVIDHRSVSEPIGTRVWGVQSDNWPDETNNWYGPVVRNSAYHSQSELTSAGWTMDCGIKTPWDDTLFISGAQFIGPVAFGHICPCAECMIVGEGGYQIRTSKLRWHNSAGTPASPKVFWEWQFMSYFFDLDGTLTESVPECQQYGCYLHSDIKQGGMYSPRDNTTSTSLLAGAASVGMAAGTSSRSQSCMNPLVGSGDAQAIPDAQITFSTVYRDDPGHKTVRLDGRLWAPSTHDQNQWVQFDFGAPKYVTAVQTKGRPDHNQWVKTYKVSYSLDGQIWKQLEQLFPGNRDRDTLMENRVSPFLASIVRIEPKSWHSGIAMRAEVLGCDAGTNNFTSTCFDRAYLDDSYRNCRAIERSYNNDLVAMQAEFCSTKGHFAKHTVFTANQACCACGGGNIHYNVFNETVRPPDAAPVTPINGGTGYLDPEKCRVVDSTGGIVCSRGSRMQTITVKDAGLWHTLTPIDVQTDYGWAEAVFNPCYKQYEFTVLQDMRHALMPPITPTKMHDWDKMSGHITMRKGDRYVIQIETLHNPDGFTVSMPGVQKTAACDQAPVKYGPDFFNNQTLLDSLSRETSELSAARQGLSLSMDMYKVAHLPLLDSAGQDNSAANWAYLQANVSTNVREWYPGMFSFLLSDRGVAPGGNHYGSWNGLRRDPTEKMVTRPLATAGGADFGFSHIHTTFAWSRWDRADPSQPGGGAGPDASSMSRLEYLVRICGMNPAAFKHLGSGVETALASHSATDANSPNPITVGNILRFRWSAWPAEAGTKPGPEANVTIQAHWEVTLDEDVTDLNLLDISGVLKFTDQPGCCTLSARYIIVGAFFGRLEAGTQSAPITQGKARIVLRGQPLTPTLSTLAPHIRGSAAWMKSKFLAVQGTLSLYGKPRSSIWAKISTSAAIGDTSLLLEGGDFQVGDLVTIDSGLETRALTAVAAEGAKTRISFAAPLERNYLGADYVHLGKQDTAGLMASYVGLVQGHTVVIEGEDTPGPPMCSLNETHTCPYATGFPRGASLADFAKQVVAGGAPPNCRPCNACSEMDYSGYVIAMAHFHQLYDRCPKDHGTVQAVNVDFIHGSSIHLYHDYAAGNYPYDVPRNFPGAWGRRPHTWWEDPIWAELQQPNLVTPSHTVRQSVFNNALCGTGLALATSGVYTVPTESVEGNVFLTGGVGLNAAARTIKTIPLTITDTAGPADDNLATVTMGVGSPSDDANPAKAEKPPRSFTKPRWSFVANFLSGAPFASQAESDITGNVFLGPVRLDGTEMEGSHTPLFKDNTISAPGSPYCVAMRTTGTKGIANNVIHSCRSCLGFRSNMGYSEGVVRNMKLLSCNLGIDYRAKGPDARKHDATPIAFKVEDTSFYAKADGGGIGLIQPTVNNVPMGEPAAPEWWNAGPMQDPIGDSSVSLFFHSELRRCQFVGFDHTKGAVAIKYGGGFTVDADYHPMMVAATRFLDMAPEAYLRFEESSNAGPGIKQCLQIDCDGRRNSLLVDVDGSLLGQPGTIIPRPMKFYDKMAYADPMGATTMEDLIPMPQRYDSAGNAIPFPSGVDHGTGGGLEYECMSTSMQADGTTPGCDVLFMTATGQWEPKAAVAALAPSQRIVAVREDGGMVRLDPLHHGQAYAGGYVRTADCRQTMNPDDAVKPESQHARRYGRAAAGQFGAHPNTSRVVSTKGPVYTVPGIFRQGCTEKAAWAAFACPGGQHRHLLIEVMDWNFRDRRVAPVTVEVNDQYSPQGGALNVLTGPAMMFPEKRTQVFHALGHVGMRHNIYFSADPPSHLRLHLQYAPPETGVVVCIFYGVPNTVYAYVNGVRKQPLAGAEPGWDNMMLTRLTPDMEHGTHFYDRVGVETGRPGYLYAVIRGGQSVDFKISHKVQLTSKVSVSASWGGWNNASGDNFFNKGLNGLVRNIALLIGAPPNRVKILGEGSAVKGTFWNEETTSKDFAEWMWKQNESMAYSDTDSWLSAPNSGGAASSASLLQLAHHQGRSAALLQTVDASRRHLLAAALSRSGRAWVGSLSRLTSEERHLVLELRAHQQLTDSGDTQMENLLKKQQATADRARLGTPCSNTNGQTCDLPVTLAVDDEDYTPASAHDVDADGMKDAVAIAEDEIKRSEIKIEDAADTMFQSIDGTGGNLTSALQVLQVSAANGSIPILNAKVDEVPHMTAPLGWLCSADWYEDGSICHCDCGIWDPDCDAGAITVPAISMAEELQLLDRTQVTVLMNLVDADGDANGVLNGNEIVELDRRLGQSALLGLAQRIVAAQERGANKKSVLTGAMRLGNFAMLGATETTECTHRLDGGTPVGPELAAFRPMCVRDAEFDTIVGQATGHCSLLPEMKVGSQCMVPGSSGVVGAKMSHNNDTSSNDTYVPSPEAVCGILGRIFRAGQGAGGHRSAGVGMSTAKWTHPGGEFLPGTENAVLDMNTLGFQRLDSSFQGGFSFYATVRVDRWADNVPLFTFAMPRGSQWDSLRHKHIAVWTKRGATGMVTLQFHMGYTTSDWRREYYANNVFPVGEEVGLLFTISPEGKVQLYKQGILIVEQDFRTNRMVVGPFDNMWIAGGHGTCPFRHCHESYGFEGLISDIRIWDSVVTWNVAVAGVPPGSQPQETGEDASGDLPAACTASRRNTWDFVCDDTVPQELAEDFGYAGTVDPRAQENFDRRQVQGEVTVCAQSLNVKSSIFHGKFGDGLTGEYFNVRRDCNPPFLFGQVPKLVRVDPAIDFQDNLGFSSAFNEYAVRWTGKILIETGGTYTFKLGSKDGSWLAVGGRLVVTNSGCHGMQEREGSVTLDKGGLSIAVLFFNRGPHGPPTGTIRMSYKGPDTQEAWSQVPQAKLASAPLRLSRLEGSSNETTNQTEAVRMGAFVYNEDTRLGVMPAGACDIPCRRGERKAQAAPFKFFCSQPTTVSFVANVNREANQALVWLDSSPVSTWDLFPAGSSLLEKPRAEDQSVQAALLQERSLSAVNGTSALWYSLGFGQGATPETFIVMPSAASPDFAVTAGEHTILFQGRAGDDEAFAFGGLRLEKGVENCVFFLEGTEKLPDDC